MKRIIVIAFFLIYVSMNVLEGRANSVVLKKGKLNVMYIGQTTSFTGTSHSSVGLQFMLEYPKESFRLIKNDHHYDNPDYDTYGMCGGDSGSVSYTIKAIKPGVYVIRTYDDFRGEVQNEVRYTVVVLEEKR